VMFWRPLGAATSKLGVLSCTFHTNTLPCCHPRRPIRQSAVADPWATRPDFRSVAPYRLDRL
jgi:hypothetical protein